MEKKVERKKEVELEQENGIKQHEQGKRSRKTDEEQEPGENQEPNKHGGKQGPNKKRVAMYGNYDHYYGYRNLKDSGDDPRLKYLKQEWFEGKDCLDVGCNAGNLTITIAKNFLCKSMVGVDIDTGLVYRAHKLLEKIAKNMEASRKSNLDVNCLNGEDIKVASHETNSGLTSNTCDTGLSGEELLKRVSFKAENFINCMNAKPTYDTVLCLSVTKWVHLNWGDDGLIKLFAKIRNLLRPGGILVLEPQPWKSYKSNHLVSEVVRQNFHEIVLRPDNFKEVLLDRVGFRSMQSITEGVVAKEKGFSRPIYLVRC